MRIVLVIAVLLAVACSREDPGDVSQQTPPGASTTTGASPQSSSTMNPPLASPRDNPAAAPTPAAATQEVHLLEYSIHIPDTLPSGHLTFRIENAGKEVHGFEIEGNGVEQSVDKIQRGDTKALDVDLKPGTYTIYCPVDGHKGKGMTKTITVK